MVDKFQSMLIFTTVAEQLGFSAAAEKLNMSPSTITKNVAALEYQLGVQLFNRTTRRIALTDLGRDYYEQCSQIMVAMATADESMRNQNSVQKGLVRMVMPYSFGRVTFIPELPAFFERYPDIDLDVHFSDEPIDMIRQGADLAILARDLEDSGLICRVLHRGPEITVASPAYLDKFGVPLSPEDLTQHRCIIGNFGDRWHFKGPDGEASSVRVKGRVTLHNGDAVLGAAVGGIGIAKSTWWLFRKELEKGRLVPVLSEWSRPGFPISVIYPARRLPSRMATVIQFLSEITQPATP